MDGAGWYQELGYSCGVRTYEAFAINQETAQIRFVTFGYLESIYNI